MELDSRIKRLHSSKFRSSLSLEDLVDGHDGNSEIVYSSNENLCSDDGLNVGEEAFTFTKNPIVFPNMSYIYATKIVSINSKWIERVVSDLLYLNPSIGSLGITKLVKWVYYNFVKYDYIDKYKDKKDYKVDYNVLHRIICVIIDKYIDRSTIDIVENNKVILYRVNSLLLGRDKNFYSRRFRSERISSINSVLIHESALLAREYVFPKLRISNPMLLKFIPDGSINSVITVRRDLCDKTIKFLMDENDIRPFKTIKSHNKWLEYLKLPEGLSSREVSKELDISTTTALKYKKIDRVDYDDIIKFLYDEYQVDKDFNIFNPKLINFRQQASFTAEV